MDVLTDEPKDKNEAEQMVAPWGMIEVSLSVVMSVSALAEKLAYS